VVRVLVVSVSENIFISPVYLFICFVLKMFIFLLVYLYCSYL
jgi:hypothetical protein